MTNNVYWQMRGKVERADEEDRKIGSCGVVE
jgi:hypothetical protein